MDSELATRTKTSASKQNLSIQLSSCDVTSVPGLQSGREFRTIRNSIWTCVVEFLTLFSIFNWLCICVSDMLLQAIYRCVPGGLSRSSYLSTSTKSSRRRAHLDFGQNTRTRQPASRLSSMWRAWASWFTVCRGQRLWFDQQQQIMRAGLHPELQPKISFKINQREKKNFLAKVSWLPWCSSPRQSLRFSNKLCLHRCPPHSGSSWSCGQSHWAALGPSTWHLPLCFYHYWSWKNH